MSADDLLARLGPQTFNIPDGARRDVSDPKQVDKTLRKVRRALELSSIGVESSTRSHGIETRSYDLSAMSPQDIAAAVGFIRDPLSRELFCLARWPGYANRMPDAEMNTAALMRSHILSHAISKWATKVADYAGKGWNRSAENPRGRVPLDWPAPCAIYDVIANTSVLCVGSALPSQEKIARACGISQPAYSKDWAAVMDWAHEETERMAGNAEHQFMSALK